MWPLPGRRRPYKGDTYGSRACLIGTEPPSLLGYHYNILRVMRID